MNVKAADIKWVIEDVEEAEGAEEGGEILAQWLSCPLLPAPK